MRISYCRQQGAALVMAMCIVLALMIIGVSAARSAWHAEKAARSERDRHIAFQAAEAALGDAERDIEGGANPDSPRAKLFADGSEIGFMPGCGMDASVGLCARSTPPALPAWQSVALAEAGVEYGRFTGASMPSGQGTQTAKPPRYVIELISLARAGEDAARRTGNFYRITALGFGSKPATQVVLQSFYLKAASGEAS